MKIEVRIFGVDGIQLVVWRPNHANGMPVYGVEKLIRWADHKRCINKSGIAGAYFQLCDAETGWMSRAYNDETSAIPEYEAYRQSRGYKPKRDRTVEPMSPAMREIYEDNLAWRREKAKEKRQADADKFNRDIFLSCMFPPKSGGTT